MSTNVARTMTVQTYNLLPCTQRKCEKGRYFALVNGEWCSVKFVKPEPVVPVVPVAADAGK